MRYKISELAKLLDISTNTIRRFEQKGYFDSIRDEQNGYRYYDDESVSGLINAKILRKYTFSHEEIDAVNDNDLDSNIRSFEEKMDEIDKKLAYLTYVRHRMKDDLVLMRKINSQKTVYEKECIEMVYVLYNDGEKLLMEPERLEKIKEFLYGSPEVQRVHIISEEDFNNRHYVLKSGLAIKEMHMDKYNMTESSCTVRYKPHRSVMKIVRLPLKNIDSDVYSDSELYDMLFKEQIAYMKENNLTSAGDIIAVVITKAKEDDEDVVYYLVSIPVNSGGGTKPI